LTKTLLNAFLDPKKAMTQHYGAIQGLGALGPNVVCVSPMFLVIVELVKGQHLEKYFWWLKDDNFPMQ